MFKRNSSETAVDEAGRTVRAFDRYHVALIVPDGATYLVGMEGDASVVELMSGEVFELAPNGDKVKVSPDKKPDILSAAQEGFALLTARTVTVPGQ